MDYEKKYNDALNLAKSYYGKGCNEFLDTIFPELRESEDERIRKSIMATIEQCPDDFLNPKNRDRMLAWLEKQKEQKPVQSEEEKEYIRTLKSRIADFLRGKDKDEVDTTYYQRICDWLDGRHVEWSKEDKGILLSVKCVIDEVWHSKNNRTDYSTNELEEMWHWLDTLWQRVEYPQPSWKPSKEQMLAFHELLGKVPRALELYELYNELEKLGVKEEPEYYQHFDEDEQ